jgi:hypothetical protein
MIKVQIVFWRGMWAVPLPQEYTHTSAGSLPELGVSPKVKDFLRNFVSSGTAVTVATSITHPLDKLLIICTVGLPEMRTVSDF